LTLRGANSSSLLVSPSITCGREIERAERERERVAIERERARERSLQRRTEEQLERSMHFIRVLLKRYT
jgi:hypothetical protein